MGTAGASAAGATSETAAVRTLHNHYLPQAYSTDLVVVPTVVIFDSVKDLAYPYTFHTNEEVPATLGDTFSSRNFDWKSRALLPFQQAGGPAKVCREEISAFKMVSFRF